MNESTSETSSTSPVEPRRRPILHTIVITNDARRARAYGHVNNLFHRDDPGVRIYGDQTVLRLRGTPIERYRLIKIRFAGSSVRDYVFNEAKIMMKIRGAKYNIERDVA